VNRRWSQPPVFAAGSPARDRGLDGALDQRLALHACARTQHWVPAQLTGTDRRSLEAHSPRLITQATSARTPETQKPEPLLRRQPEKHYLRSIRRLDSGSVIEGPVAELMSSIPIALFLLSSDDCAKLR
jgi:hypothetical protein